MKMEYLESFLAINKYKSLSEAARALFITQPTLSSRLSTLETYLDVKLFERSWNGVKLTNHGVLFLPYALQMINHLEDFTTLTTNYQKITKNNYVDSIDQIFSTFKIGMNNYLVDTYGKNLIHQLRKNFPNINYEIMTASSKELVKLMNYGVLDYIIYYDFKPNLLNTELIQYDEMVMILCEQDYLMVQDDITHIRFFKKPLYLNSNPVLDIHLPYYNHFQSTFKTYKTKIVYNLELIKLLIKDGQGFTVLPDSIYESLFKDKGLYKIRIPDYLPKLPVYSTYREKLEQEQEDFVIYSTYLNNILQYSNQNISNSNVNR